MSKRNQAARWLALMLCVSAFCMPMMGAMMEGEGAAEEIMEVMPVLPVEPIPAEPIQEMPAPEPQSAPQEEWEPVVMPVVHEQVESEPQASEPADAAPDLEPEPQDELEPPPIEPEPDPPMPTDGEEEPTPSPDPTIEPEPTPEMTDEPMPSPEPTLDITDEPIPSPEPTTDPPATCPPTEPPMPDALYNVLVDAPTVWMTEPTKITIRVEDMNGVGWIGITGQVQFPKDTVDVSNALSASGTATVDINGNCIVMVVITDPAGKAHEFTRQAVCYDRTPPVVKASIEGRVLRTKATDDLSGVAYLYVNDQRFDKLVDGGLLDVALKDLENYTEYKQIRVHCVDWAGNESETVKLKNPLYKTGSSNSNGGGSGGGGGGSATPVYPAKPTLPAATATPEPTEVSKTPTATPTPLPTPTPAPNAPNPFSVDGTGTVLNYAGSSDGKEFFIVTTPNENTFYLVIDRQRGTENVYFLDAVTERDLLSLAESSGQVMPTPEPTPMPVVTPAPTPESAPEAPPPEKGNNSMIFILILVALAARAIISRS